MARAEYRWRRSRLARGRGRAMSCGTQQPCSLTGFSSFMGAGVLRRGQGTPRSSMPLTLSRGGGWAWMCREVNPRLGTGTH